MAAVKGKDTKPELIVRKYLFSKGLRYRLHSKNLKGHPDIVLPKFKTVIFINGCFWHGHDGCENFRIPKSNVEFWQKKIRHNKARDVSNEFVLQSQGWKVIKIWECEIKNTKLREQRLERLYHEITAGQKSLNPYPIFSEETQTAAEPSAPYRNI